MGTAAVAVIKFLVFAKAVIGADVLKKILQNYKEKRSNQSKQSKSITFENTLKMFFKM